MNLLRQRGCVCVCVCARVCVWVCVCVFKCVCVSLSHSHTDISALSFPFFLTLCVFLRVFESLILWNQYLKENLIWFLAQKRIPNREQLSKNCFAPNLSSVSFCLFLSVFHCLSPSLLSLSLTHTHTYTHTYMCPGNHVLSLYPPSRLIPIITKLLDHILLEVRWSSLALPSPGDICLKPLWPRACWEILEDRFHVESFLWQISDDLAQRYSCQLPLLVFLIFPTSGSIATVDQGSMATRSHISSKSKEDR